MRLAHVSTRDAANQFLEGSLPIYNRRFTIQPAQRPVKAATGKPVPRVR